MDTAGGNTAGLPYTGGRLPTDAKARQPDARGDNPSGVGLSEALGRLPTDAKARKDIPIYSGFIKYFPLAMAAVAELSRKGNDQHNPGKPLHWDRSKSGDELDALMRHLVDEAAGTSVDTDGVLHLTKTAWRAMAALQKVLEGGVAAPAVETDYPSRWVMQTKTGAIWTTNGIYTKAEINNAALLSRPVRRI